MKELAHAYILHRRLFRDTSLIVDFFTYEHGCISVVAKGARSEKSKNRNSLQYFAPLMIDCYGRSELLTLKSVETCGIFPNFTGDHLLSMLYVNELLIKLLHKHEPHPIIFSAYQQLITQLMLQANIEEQLRRFEMKVLQELGYAVNFLFDYRQQASLIEDALYVFHIEQGLVQVSKATNNSYLGSILQKIYQEDFSSKAVLIAAKQLFRQIFAELLQHKTINSRQLYSSTIMFKKNINESRLSNS